MAATPFAVLGARERADKPGRQAAQATLALRSPRREKGAAGRGLQVCPQRFARLTIPWSLGASLPPSDSISNLSRIICLLAPTPGPSKSWHRFLTNPATFAHPKGPPDPSKSPCRAPAHSQGHTHTTHMPTHPPGPPSSAARPPCSARWRLCAPVWYHSFPLKVLGARRARCRDRRSVQPASRLYSS